MRYANSKTWQNDDKNRFVTLETENNTHVKLTTQKPFIVVVYFSDALLNIRIFLDDIAAKRKNYTIEYLLRTQQRVSRYETV